MKYNLILILSIIFFGYSCQSASVEEEFHDLSVSGFWHGLAFGMSDIPEKPNVPIRFVFEQEDSKVTGTLALYSQTYSISNGSNFNNVFSFITLKSVEDSIYYYFEGTVTQDTISGNWSLVSIPSGHIYVTNDWFIARDHEGR